jgi:integrase
LENGFHYWPLEWQQIDMQRHVAWIHPDQAKAAKAIGVPLNDDAVAVLKAQIGKHHTHVTYKGKPIAKAGTLAVAQSTKTGWH